MNLVTRLRSTGMRHFSSLSYLEKLRRNARSKRKKSGQPAVVHYFHQVDDPYSHLAVQKIDQLKAQYNIHFQPHLVSAPDAAFRGDSTHFDAWARRDAINIAEDYQTSFNPTVEAPSQPSTQRANQLLANILDKAEFTEVALQVGTSIWTGVEIDPAPSSVSYESTIAAGNTLRQKLGHYQGAMFHFEGEWFWGVDRIRSLEERLTSEGFKLNKNNNINTLCVPEPTPTDTTDLDTSNILLEYFPSLRSPYTAIGHQRVLDLIARSGVRVEVRPVMPMLMRGIPAPRLKQRYIITDAGREARAHGYPFGHIVDPFGEPVKRAFALFSGAAKLGKEMEFVTAYLNAAWFDGIDITKPQGLQQVAANADIEWQDLTQATQNTDWRSILDDNLQSMASENLWGVPSFRVTGGNSPESYACWGQDRIWRVENEIAKRVSA